MDIHSCIYCTCTLYNVRVMDIHVHCTRLHVRVVTVHVQCTCNGYTLYTTACSYCTMYNVHALLLFRLKSIEAEVKDMEKSSKINERSYIKDKSIYDAVQKEIANVQSSMDKLQYREGNIEELKEKR